MLERSKRSGITDYHFHHLEPVLENEIGYDVTHRVFIENKLILVPVFYRKIQ